MLVELIEFHLQRRTIEPDTLILELWLPIVDAAKYTVYACEVPIAIRNDTAIVTSIPENVILISEGGTWGYSITEAEYENCGKYWGEVVCNLKGPQENLMTAEKCIADIVLRNSTGQCTKRVIRLKHTLWVPTASKNQWRYLAPKKENIMIRRSGSITQREIIGLGTITIEKGMEVANEHVRFEHYREDEEEAEEKLLIPFEDLPTYEPEHPVIPEWNEKSRIVLPRHTKELLDLGVDVSELMTTNPNLKNVEYAPLDNPWTNFYIISGFIGAGLIVLYMYRGRITCCA